MLCVRVFIHLLVPGATAPSPTASSLCVTRWLERRSSLPASLAAQVSAAILQGEGEWARFCRCVGHPMRYLLASCILKDRSAF